MCYTCIFRAYAFILTCLRGVLFVFDVFIKADRACFYVNWVEIIVNGICGA